MRYLTTYGRSAEVDFEAQPLVEVVHGGIKVTKEVLDNFRQDPTTQPLPLGEIGSFTMAEGEGFIRDIRTGIYRATGRIEETGQSADIRIHKPKHRSWIAQKLGLTSTAFIQFNTPAFSEAKDTAAIPKPE